MAWLRKKIDVTEPEIPPRQFPVTPPLDRPDGLRDFAAQRNFVLDLLKPLAPFGVSLLDAVGLTLSESIAAEQSWPNSGIKQGDSLVTKGVRVEPRLVGLLAASGIVKVMARPRPRIVVVPVGRPSQALTGGKDLASFLVAAELQAQGAQVYHVPGTAADPEELVQLLSDQLIRADLMVTVGGFADDEVGIAQVLRRLGLAETPDVALTPGRQQGVALIGDDDTPLIALPSEPLAAHILLVTLVVPAVRKLMDADEVLPPLERARVTQPVSVTPGMLTAAHVVVDGATVSFRARRTGPDALVAIHRSQGIALMSAPNGHLDIGSWVDYVPLDR